MTELVALPQPYPDNRPWLDLRTYLEPSWKMSSSSFHFRGLIEANTVTIQLRTAEGTNETIAPFLPDEFIPPGNMVFQASSPWLVESLHVFLRGTNGELKLYNPGRPSYADGSLNSLITQFSFQRKAV
ncbi:hypothetical protein [Glutamicibacter arilaitensis]|uniref:hypothetical protein n=1 Tax=Glutamicibacter arilaitensis TaxID=256701 RepID=UPI003FD61CF9